MAKTLLTREALGNISDLTTPTSTQQYVLGHTVDIYDDTYKAIKRYMYVKAGAALTQYAVYVISYSSTAGAEVTTATPPDPAGGLNLYHIACVPEVAFTDGYYGFVCIQGNTTAAHAGTTTTLHALKITDATASFTTEAATTVTDYTAAIAVAGSSGAGNATVYLIGNGKQSHMYAA